MSMYRQLWLSMLVCMVLALGASLFASLMNARHYLEDQLAMKNQDNASTLALALSKGETDHNDVVVAVTALFNSGHYAHIMVVDPAGKMLVEKIHADTDVDAPAWFARWLPIQSTPGQAEISSGWQPIGNITVMSRVDFAYRSLWDTAIMMTAVIVAVGLLGGVLAGLVLRRLRRATQTVIDQARAINEHRFVTIPEPDVPELRELATAMNDTVNRLRDRFEDDAKLYDGLRRAANYDVLTGLANRTFFLASLEHALDTENSLFGSLALVRLGNLAKLNRVRGRHSADDLLSKVGRAIGDLSGPCPGFFAGRLNGSDFALLLPTTCDVQAILSDLLNELRFITESDQHENVTVFIGYGQFSRGDHPTRLLARIDAAVALLESRGNSALSVAASASDPNLPGDAEEWRVALRHALRDKHALRLVRHTVRLDGDNATHVECPLRIRLREDGDWLTASRFLPQAERLGLVQELDMATLILALDELENNILLGGLWVNLSARSIADPEFRAQLIDLLHEHPNSCQRLWLEIPETGGLRRLSALRDLARELKPMGVRLGLEHYGHHFNQIGLLYDLGLDFLKVDSAFIQGIDINPGNQAFLQGLCEIAHRIGIQVFAEGVEDQAELAKLAELGFDGVTGVAVHDNEH